MTQNTLIKNWILENGSILPAKIAGVVFQGVMFGSESSKRCREMRARGIVHSAKDARFERFSLAEPIVYLGKPSLEELLPGKVIQVKNLSLNQACWEETKQVIKLNL